MFLFFLEKKQIYLKLSWNYFGTKKSFKRRI